MLRFYDSCLFSDRKDINFFLNTKTFLNKKICNYYKWLIKRILYFHFYEVPPFQQEYKKEKMCAAWKENELERACFSDSLGHRMSSAVEVSVSESESE